MNDALAHSSVERIRGRSRVQTAAAGRDRVSLWKRLERLYRFFAQAKEISLRVEGAPPQRRSEIAFHYLWRGR